MSERKEPLPNEMLPKEPLHKEMLSEDTKTSDTNPDLPPRHIVPIRSSSRSPVKPGTPFSPPAIPQRDSSLQQDDDIKKRKRELQVEEKELRSKRLRTAISMSDLRNSHVVDAFHRQVYTMKKLSAEDFRDQAAIKHKTAERRRLETRHSRFDRDTNVVMQEADQDESEAFKLEERAVEMEKDSQEEAGQAVLEDLQTMPVTKNLMLRVWALIQSKVLDRPEDRHRKDQEKFRSNLLKAYNAVKEDDPSRIWCPVLRMYIFQRPAGEKVIAAHLFPVGAGQPMMDCLFSDSDAPGSEPRDLTLMSLRNGLPLHSEIEHHFDMFEVAIVPVSADNTDGRWKFLLMNKQLENQDPREGGPTYKELHMRELKFLSDFRPSARLLYFHYLLCLVRAKEGFNTVPGGRTPDAVQYMDAALKLFHRASEGPTEKQSNSYSLTASKLYDFSGWQEAMTGPEAESNRYFGTTGRWVSRSFLGVIAGLVGHTIPDADPEVHGVMVEDDDVERRAVTKAVDAIKDVF